MRLDEFENIELEEDWRKKVAAGALGLAALSGLPNLSPSNLPQGYKASHQLPKPQRPLTKIENYLAKTGKQAGMAGHEIAQLLAQASHETGNFMAMEEQGDKKYLLHNYWNNVPMRKALGNKHPSDAIRYKGRGFIQLTGRGNYERMGKLLKIDLLNHPELAKRPDIASKIAVQYFKDRIEPSVQDFNNTQAVTKKINPHDKPESVKDRDDKFQQYKNLLGMN